MAEFKDRYKQVTFKAPKIRENKCTIDIRLRSCTWGVEVVRYPNFFSGMEADRNVKVVGGDVAVL